MSLVELSKGDRVLLLRFAEPILSAALLGELETTLEEIVQSPARLPVVLTSRHPRIFLAGANLQEIASLGHATSRPYARRGRQVLQRLADLPVATVAAVHGACAGGGLDLALSCDLVVAARGVPLSHPGVRRGLVTGWGGTVLLPASVGPSPARRALLEGSPLEHRHSSRCGRTPEAAQDVLACAVGTATHLASLHPMRLHAWRALRKGRFVDMFRTFVVHNEL